MTGEASQIPVQDSGTAREVTELPRNAGQLVELGERATQLEHALLPLPRSPAETVEHGSICRKRLMERGFPGLSGFLNGLPQRPLPLRRPRRFPAACYPLAT